MSFTELLYRFVAQPWKRDHLLALAVGTLALAASPIATVITHIFAQTLPLTAAAGSFTYLLLARLRSGSVPTPRNKSSFLNESTPSSVLDHTRQHIPREVTLLAPSIVFLLCATALAFALIAGRRSLPFYAVMIIAATIFFLQVIGIRDRDFWPALLCGQLLAIMASLRLPALALTPSWIGVDILSHGPRYTQIIYETGSLAAGLSGSKYISAPLYHLLVVATALLGEISVRSALYASLGIAMLVVPFTIYAIALRFGVPPRWALFATAMFGLTDYLTYWSLHLIPSSLGVIFLCSLLLLFSWQFTGDEIGRLLTLSPTILLLIALALTDQVSSFIMLTFLAAGVLTQISLQIADWITTIPATLRVDMTAYTVFLLGLLVFVWSFTPLYGGSFITSVLELATSSIGDISLLNFGPSGGGEDTGGEAGAVSGGTWGEIFTYLSRGSFLGLTFVAALGTYACLRPGASSQARWTLITGATVIAIAALAPPLIGVSTLLPGRWFIFLYALLAILAALGLAILSGDPFWGRPPIQMSQLSRAGALIFTAMLVLISITYPAAAIASTVATPDSPILTEEQPREALTAPEHSAAETLGEITRSSESRPIRSDSYYAIVLSRTSGEDYYAVTIPDADREGIEKTTQDDVIYRSYQSYGAPQFHAEDGERYITQVSEPQMCQGSDSILYDNPDVRYCSSL